MRRSFGAIAAFYLGLRSVRRVYVLLYPLASLLVLGSAAGCKRVAPPLPRQDMPQGTPVAIVVPLGLPPLSVPRDNRPTRATIALGRRLFYDPRLSDRDRIACASCHQPERRFTDGERLSRGVSGTLAIRNAPTLLNVAYLPFQFWDGRSASLEEQAASPISNPLEMNQPHAAAVAKLERDPVYRLMFTAAFSTEHVTLARVEKALASFERTLLSGDSPFDRYEYGGDPAALTAQQVRGLAIFRDPARGNCAACHTLGAHDALFTDGKFHNTGQGITDDGRFSDEGRVHQTKVMTDTGAFKTPTLRNVAETAPYMHDGNLKTLKDVIDFYAGGGNSNNYLDPEMKAIHLTGRDRADLLAFLDSLTGSLPPDSGPPDESPPASGDKETKR